MKLILQHVANPDIQGGGYWQEPESPKLLSRDVVDERHARETFNTWIRVNGLGGGNMGKRCGELWRDGKTLIGHFSYNGRLWASVDNKRAPWSAERVEIIIPS